MIGTLHMPEWMVWTCRSHRMPTYINRLLQIRSGSKKHLLQVMFFLQFTVKSSRTGSGLLLDRRLRVLLVVDRVAVRDGDVGLELLVVLVLDRHLQALVHVFEVQRVVGDG